MNREQLTYTCRPSLLGPSALRLGDDGLVLSRWYGDLTIPWHTIRAVHRPRAHQAELELADGKRVPLPLHGDELPALIESISARCDAAVAELRGLAHDAQALRDALGLEPGGAIVCDANATAQWGGSAGLLIGLGMIAFGAQPGWIAWLALVGSVLVLLAAWGRAFAAVRITEAGITAYAGIDQWAVRWSDITGVDKFYSGRYRGTLNITLITTAGLRVFSGDAGALACVADTAKLVAEARSAHFDAGDADVPETALSLASPDHPAIDRGLSLSGNQQGDRP